MQSALTLLRDQRITLLLVLTIVVMLVAASWVGWRLTNRYETFIADFQQRQAEDLVKVATDDLLWNRYEAFGIELAQSVSRNKALPKAIRGSDTDVIVAALADEFNQGLIAEGRVNLRGFTVFDTKGAIKGESWVSGTSSRTVPAEMLSRVFSREGAERLESMSVAWTTDAGPILSIFAPIGGLRLRGYLAAHLDLIHALTVLDTRLGMNVQLRRPGTTVGLKTLDNVALPSDAVTNAFDVPITMRSGDPLLDLYLEADVTGLVSQLASTRTEFFLLFLAVAGTAGIVGVVIVSLALHRGKAREAKMQAAAEAARQAEELERIESAARQARLEEEKAEELRHSVFALCDRLESDLEAVVGSVSEHTGDMRTDAGTLNRTVQRLNDMVSTVSGSAQDASGNIQTVASATEQLANSSQEIGARVAESAAIASQAAASAQATNTTVTSLSDAAQRIGQVATLIQDIAEQTNLLALNATIEAARAGEAGKGFAVVASEVKSLANQTASATEEIGSQIRAIQSAAGETVTAIGGITGEITNINEVVTAIASAAEEQVAAIQEIARNSQQASSGIRTVSDSTVGAADETRSVAGIATQFEGTTQAVGDQIEEMLVRIKGVLSEVRKQNGSGDPRTAA